MKLRPLKHRELTAKLRKLGFNGPFQRGKHPYFLRGSRVVWIPNPHGNDIGKDIVKDILNQLGIIPEEFFEL